MTAKQFDREKNYGAAMAIARAMLAKGIITEDEYNKIDAMFTEKYRPLIGCTPACFDALHAPGYRCGATKKEGA